MAAEQLLQDHDVFIFGLDDVIYPERDYLLQVYYLFAQFMEYAEQRNANEILEFMKETYVRTGETDIFNKTTLHFNLPEKYQVNFDLLHHNARLPLKLLLYARVLTFMKRVIAEGKALFLLVEGAPDQQLNKIRQMEWNGLEPYLTVYFTNEVSNGNSVEALNIIAEKHNLDPDKVVSIVKDATLEKYGQIAGIKLRSADKLFSA